ncbi:hypothetical protein D3C76_1289370 [compost metagenome]
MIVNDPAGFSLRDHVGLAVGGLAISFCGPAVELMVMASGTARKGSGVSPRLLSLMLLGAALENAARNTSGYTKSPPRYFQSGGGKKMPGNAPISVGGVLSATVG